MLQNYVSSLKDKVSDALQLFFDSLAEMLIYFNNLEENEKRGRPYLWEAMGALGDIYRQITNGQEFQGSITLSLSTTEEWMPQLKEALAQAEVVRLLWIADILQSSNQTGV